MGQGGMCCVCLSRSSPGVTKGPVSFCAAVITPVTHWQSPVAVLGELLGWWERDASISRWSGRS